MTRSDPPIPPAPSTKGTDASGRQKPSLIGRLGSDDLLRHTGILFSGMMLVHVCSLVFQMAVSRALPAEEYTLLAAFLATLAILQRPLGTLTTGISHYSSLLSHEGRTGDIKRLLRKWLLLTGAAALVSSAAALVFKVPLAAFLDMDRTAPVVIMGAVLPGLFFLPVLSGAVQGLEEFTWRSVGMSLGAIARLGLGAGFVWFLYPACGWAMLGHGLGVYVTVSVLLLGLIFTLRGKPSTGQALPSMRFYLLQSFIIQSAYAVLMTADVVLVKHYLPDNGEFAYAGTLGRLVVFLPGAIAIAMFPKVTSGRSTTRAQKSVFLRSFAYTALCVAATVAACWLAGGLLAHIVLGVSSPSEELSRLVGLMGLAMGFSALLNVLLQFLLAQRRFAPAYQVIAFAVLYLGSSAFFHDSARQVALAAIACNAAALAALLLVLWRKRWYVTEAEDR